MAVGVSWKEECEDLLEILNQSEDAGPFRKPISILNVPNYLQVIEHATDFQTVREKLEANNYATPNAFAKDVRLIFENSRKFNTNTKSKIYGQTVRLSFLFEEYFLNILDTYETQKTTDGCKSKLPPELTFCQLTIPMFCRQLRQSPFKAHQLQNSKSCRIF